MDLFYRPPGSKVVDLKRAHHFNHTLTENTTLYFENPPPSGSVGSFALEITGADVTVGYDLANAAYDGDAARLTGINGFSEGIFFKPDGTKLYITGISTDAVQQYTLSTAFDLSTATYDSISFSVASQETSPKAVIFNNDGTKMYISGSDNDTCYQYSLSTAWNVSTASYASKSFSFSTQDGNPNSITWNNDGTKLYLGGLDSNRVYEYDLSTAFDLSTASYNSVNLDLTGAIGGSADGLQFNNDGSKLFVSARSTVGIYQFSLTTAYDLSTASYDSVSYNYGGQTSGPHDIYFKSDGSKLFVLNRDLNAINSYTTSASAPATVTYPSSVKWSGATTPDAPADGEKDLYVFVTTDGGTTYYGKQAGDALA
jgi:sugar lactone lactonase YvrE